MQRRTENFNILLLILTLHLVSDLVSAYLPVSNAGVLTLVPGSKEPMILIISYLTILCVDAGVAWNMVWTMLIWLKCFMF